MKVRILLLSNIILLVAIAFPAYLSAQACSAPSDVEVVVDYDAAITTVRVTPVLGALEYELTYAVSGRTPVSISQVSNIFTIRYFADGEGCIDDLDLQVRVHCPDSSWSSFYRGKIATIKDLSKGCLWEYILNYNFLCSGEFGTISIDNDAQVSIPANIFCEILEPYYLHYQFFGSFCGPCLYSDLYSAFYGTFKTSVKPAGDGDLSVMAFPNPFNDMLTISVNNTGNQVMKLSIYNLQGQVVYQASQAKPVVDITTASWTSGIYMYQVQLGNELLTGKIQK